MSEERQPARSLLCSEADRERAADVLRAAMTDGRLDLEEFSRRLDAAHAVRTVAELSELVGDLPALSGSDAQPPRQTAAFSHVTRSAGAALAPRSRYRCLWGTLDLDLSNASVIGGEAVIEVLNVFGTVSITVPEGVGVDVDGRGLFASQLVERSPTRAAPHAPTLRIRVRGPGGTCYVRYAGRHRPGRCPSRYI